MKRFFIIDFLRGIYICPPSLCFKNSRLRKNNFFRIVPLVFFLMGMNFSVFAQILDIIDEPVEGWYRIENGNFNIWQSEDVQSLFDEFNEKLEIGNSELSISPNSSSGIHPFSDKFGYSHKFYRQKYGPSIVEDGGFHVQTFINSTNIEKINGKVVDEGFLKKINPVATINAPKAIEEAINYLKNKLNIETFVWEDNTGYYPETELLITSNLSSATDVSFGATTEYMPYVLAYRIPIYTSIPFGGQQIYVNAHNGKIIKYHSLFNNLCENDPYPNCELDTEVCTLFGDLCIKTYFKDGVYKLIDKCRGDITKPLAGIYSKDLSLGSSNDSNVEQFVFEDEDGNWDCSNATIVNALSVHYIAEQCFDWYIDMGIKETIHRGKSLKVTSNFSGGSQAGPSGIAINTAHSGFIDVIGHEFTHTIEGQKELPIDDVTESSGIKESLGIEESFCDILGVLFEADMNEKLTGQGYPDYAMQGTDRDYTTYVFYPTNSEGVFTGGLGMRGISNVQNHWFYLLSEGGHGITPNGENYNICPINHTIIREMVFRNFRYLLGGSINLYDARQGALWALEDLYSSNNGYFSTEEEYLNTVRQVTNAWYAVGVGESYDGESNNLYEIVGDLGICHGESTTLAASLHNSYSWSTGETTQAITVSEEGTYTVEFGGVDNEGNSYCDASLSVEVFRQPFVDLREDENGEATLCLGQKLNFGANEEHSFQWSTGETSPQITPQTTGIYTVTVTEGSCSNTGVINITHLWQVQIDPSSGTLIQESPKTYVYCDFDNNVLSLSLSGDFDELSNLTWYEVTSEGEEGIEEDISVINVTEPGKYVVRFSEDNTMNGGNCQVVDKITILGPVSSQQIPDQNICSGDGFGFDINEYFTDGLTYTISPPNNEQQVTVDENGFKNYSVTQGGQYTITANGHCNSPVSETFQVNLTDLQVEEIIVGDDVCGRASLTAISSSANVTYQWTSANSNQSSNNAIFQPQNQTSNPIVDTYTVEVTSENCTAMASVDVTVNPIPKKPEFTVSDLSNECGKELKMDIIPSYTGDTKTWYLDGEVISSGVESDFKNLTAKTPGVYTAQVTNSYGCVSPLSTSTTVTMNDLMPEVDFEVVVTDTETWNDTFANVSTTTDISSFTWTSTTGPDHILGPLVIPEGVELNISNKTITFLDEYSGISVEEGGRLRLNKATLQAHECSGMNWKGIDVGGNRNANHEVWYNNPLSGQLHPDHGIVIVKNGTVVRDALIGIYAYDAADVVGNDTGGGFVYLDKGTNTLPQRNKFINNQIGIYMGYHDAIQRSLITDTDFINDAPFINGTANSWAGRYKHIVLNRASRNIDGQVDGGLHIYGNSFSTDDNSDLNGVARGIGIVAIQTNITIGSEENNSFEPNEFTNLDKGIDIYSTASLMNVTNVINNQFYNNHHAITLNTTPTAIVSANYIELPTEATANYPAHGIFIKQSYALTMEGNRLVSKDNMVSSNPSINQVKGIVFQDCFVEGQLISEIKENRFEGAIGAGTQFEGNSQRIQLFCNKYLEDGDTGEVPLNDWFLPEKSDAETATGDDTEIDVQGDCNALEFWQDWHSINNFPNRRHIFNLANHIVELNHGGTPPIIIQGGNDVELCPSAPPSSPCEPVFVAPHNDDGIVYTTPIYPPNPPQPPRPTGQCEMTTKDIQYLLATHQVHEVLNNLACLQQDWSNKLLVNTYNTNDDEQNARFYLNRISQNTTENLEFHQLYEAVWDGQIHQVENIANNLASSNAALAQAYLAAMRGDVYQRKSMPLEETSNKKGLREITIIDNGFVLYPNPSSTHLKVVWTAKFKELDEDTFSIYDLNGRCVLKTTIESGNNVIDTSSIPNGVYYCHLKSTNEVQKLMIIQ